MSDPPPENPWWPNSWKESAELPAFRVQRQTYGPVSGGDYVRGSTGGLASTALRYPSTVPGYDLVAGRATLVARPKDHSTVEVLWDWPDSLAETWQEVSLVRSVFGFPSTVNDGVTLYRAPRAYFHTEVTDGFGNEIMYVPPVVEDQNLPGNRWYYYSLFFRTSPFDWVLGMSDSTLVPADHHHAEHLYNAVPPYYQWVDDNMRPGEGPLKHFLKVFGFELDTTRAYVDTYQELYHFDLSPVPLLKHVGDNIGVPYEAALGDIRYRAMLAQIGKLYDIRGTAEGLERFCEATSKYECDVTGGVNLLPQPDDSNPYWSIGNWASVHPDSWAAADIPLTDPIGLQFVRLYLPKEGYPAAWDASYPATAPVSVNPPLGGTGVIRIDTVRVSGGADEDTLPLMLTIGDGIQVAAGQDPSLPDNQTETVPLYDGVPVVMGQAYGFSFYVKTAQPLASPLVVTPILLWAGATGQPIGVVDTTLGNPASVTLNNDWEMFELQAIAPDDAFYLVPSIYFNGRVHNPGSLNFSYPIDIGSVIVYKYGPEEGGGAAISPDRYLTLGDPNEKLGMPDPTATPTPFPGYLIGAPIEET